MGSNPGWVELGVHSTSVSLTWIKVTIGFSSYHIKLSYVSLLFQGAKICQILGSAAFASLIKNLA